MMETYCIHLSIKKLKIRMRGYYNTIHEGLTMKLELMCLAQEITVQGRHGYMKKPYVYM